MQQWTLATGCEAETRQLGERLGRLLDGAAVLLLFGPLGAGKTVFAQGVARGLGVPAEVPVCSPTYTLHQQYRGRLVLNHYDLYRIGDVGELAELGLDEFAHGDGVALIEWGERLGEAFFDHLAIRLERVSAEGRRLSLQATGMHYQGLLAQLVRRWQGPDSVI